MGNSCAKGAGRSNPSRHLRSNATTLPGEQTTSNATPSPGEQTTFKWVIDGFSSLLDKDQGWIQSAVFEMMGIKWYLKLNPKYKKINEEEYVSLKLQQAQSSVKLDTVVEASFRFKIYDQSNGKHRVRLANHSFETASTISGISCMLPLKKLNEQPSGFLVNNSCIFGIEFIKVATIKANTTIETLIVRKMNVFNEAKVYTWEIDDFFALKSTSCSPEFEIGGYTWYINMYPSSDGNLSRTRRHSRLKKNKRRTMATGRGVRSGPRERLGPTLVTEAQNGRPAHEQFSRCSVSDLLSVEKRTQERGKVERSRTNWPAVSGGGGAE